MTRTVAVSYLAASLALDALRRRARWYHVRGYAVPVVVGDAVDELERVVTEESARIRAELERDE